MKRIFIIIAVIILFFTVKHVNAESAVVTGKIIPFTISYHPDSIIKDTSPSTKTFNVMTGINANFSWYFDGTLEKSDKNVSSSSFTKTAGEGTHNVTVIVTANERFSITWVWKVFAQPPSRTSGGGGGGGMFFILPTPNTVESPKPTPASVTIPSIQSPTPTPTRVFSPEIEEPITTPQVESESPTPVTMDFSFATEFSKWFRSVLMVSSSFVLAYFGKNY